MSIVFRKLLLSAFVLAAFSVALLDFYLTRYTAQRETQAVERQLAAQARVLAGELERTEPGSLEAWAHDASRRATARVTVIDADGSVLADSDHDPESMENHADRPEIAQAYQGRTGTAIRRSATLARDLCYVAMPAPSPAHPRAVLRMAVPLAEIDRAIAAVRRRILEASALTVALALLAGAAISGSLTRRIGRLKRFAETLLDKPAAEPLAPEANDEIGDLARSLSAMGARMRDLVDRLRLESGRREAILASLAEGVIAVDSQMRVIFCNQSFARSVNARTPLPERLPLLELVRDPGLSDALAEVVASGCPARARVEISGRTFDVETAPLATSSHRGAIAILRDITDLERLERIRRDFVANVSHELRTPLAAIIGYTETLLDGALEDAENNRKFLEIVRAHAVRLNNIASDLLSLSELDARKAPPVVEPIDLAAVLESARTAVDSAARDRGVKLLIEGAGELRVTGHKTRLEQALVNLLDNAIKFNRPGGEVRLSAATRGAMVQIAVSDTGIGIPSQELPRIFERFYRVDKGRSRAQGGTGLGLSIVKHAVEQMQGSIAVESELGKGSTFTVSLPAA